MSSTNRSDSRKNHEADYYVTPINEIETFLKEFDKKECVYYWSNCLILDVSAGGNKEVKDEQGNIIKPYHPMSYPTAIKNVFGWCNIKTYDIREDSLAEVKGNYLDLELKSLEPDIIITNPPFSLSMEFIKKALDDVRHGGYVIMLLRLNFLETKARKKFFEEYMPQYIFVHHKRMSFTDDKKTDSCAYCHMVWKKDYYPEFAKIKVI